MSESAAKAFKENNGRVMAEDVLSLMEGKNAELIKSEMMKNWRQNALLRVARFLKKTYADNYEDSLQLALPGLPAPAAIAVKKGIGQYAYVLFNSARWEDLKASDNEREDNIDYAVKSKEDWVEKMDYLQPTMEGTNLTVQEAVAIIDSKRKAA